MTTPETLDPLRTAKAQLVDEPSLVIRASTAAALAEVLDLDALRYRVSGQAYQDLIALAQLAMLGRARIAANGTHSAVNGAKGGQVREHQESWISVRAAATAAGVAERTIRAAIERQTLRATRFGRQWVIDPASLAKRYPASSQRLHERP